LDTSIFSKKGYLQLNHEILNKFDAWWHKAKNNSPLNQENAICVSTIDEQGFPHGRFVDLKSVTKQGFIFCSDYKSAKGQQISSNAKVAITVWWDHVGYQVRVVGNATRISEEQAQEFWLTRSVDAQITTCAFQQSKALQSNIVLESSFMEYKNSYSFPLSKPQSWGGYVVEPISIEFLTFKESRLHLREFYQLTNAQWCQSNLQP
jgi:pyridoxamine 5'-phosphate oxidase